MARLARTFSRGNANVSLEEFGFVDQYAATTAPTQTAAAAAIMQGETTNNINDNHTTTAELPRLQANNNKNNDNDNNNDQAADFTFVLECKYLSDKSVQVYDHMIVLGTVERIVSPTAAAATVDQTARHAKEDFCLMYADTRFWKMGEEV